MLRSVNKIRIYDRKEKAQCFFWNTFGCASLAASKRIERSCETTPYPHSKHQAKRPRTNDGASPELGLLFFPKAENCARPERQHTGSFCFVCSTLSMACTGMAHERLLPCAICVQRFGNKMILQLIPLIARCCVLQRNRKPSHPSRHVVGAVLNPGCAGSSGKNKNVFLCWVRELFF